jgi:hypothetical protein
MKHLTNEQLSARLDQQPAGRSEEIERHLAECAQCRNALAALTDQDRFLVAALAHDPGDEYFTTFAARVEDRLRAESLRGAQARLGHDQAPWLRWFQAPRRIAWIGAVATVVAGAAIVIVTSRDDRVTTISALEVRSAPQPAPTDQVATPPTSEREEADSRSLASAPPATRAQSRDDAVALAPAPAAEPGASPARMRQVGPTAHRGADVRPPEPAPAAPAPEGQSQGHRVMKRNYAQPLEADKNLAANEAKKVDEVRQESSAPAPAPATLQARDAAGSMTEKEKASTGGSSAPGFAAPPVASGLAAAPRAGEVQLCGQVVDPDGRPVAHASVMLVTIGRTTTSSDAGAFCLSAPEGSFELSVMAVGFQTSRMQVRVAGERSDVRVTMSAISVLDGVAKSTGGRLDAGEPVKLNTTAGEKSAARPAAPAPAKDQAKAKTPPVDPFTGESKSATGLATTAMEATRFASTYPTIPTWEKAAKAWGSATTALKTPAGRSEAFYRIAQAKLMVWRQYPNLARKNDALSACLAVLSGAPTPAQRKDVMRWMTEVRSGPIGRD